MTDKVPLKATLTASQAALYKVLRSGNDVPITTLYATLYGTGTDKTVTRQQQAIGAHITRLNMQLVPRGRIIKPGTMKQTYRLYELPDTAPARTPTPRKKRG